MNNNTRYDISKRLIHFFREVDTYSKNSVIFPEYWGFDHLVEHNKFPPFFLLRSAIRHGRLFASWSIRNNNRTIYGKTPAICFSEMPLAAFIQSSIRRKEKGQLISTYAITFNKSDLFSIGARPVIYGLSTEPVNTSSNKRGDRLIDETQLPINEQYRYVTYHPIGNKKIDWTHEREWRWPYRDSLESYYNQLDNYGMIDEVDNIPSLIFNQYEFKDIGVIVKTQKEAEIILSDILIGYDKFKYTPFSFIFYTSQISSLKQILTPKQEKKEIQKSIINLDPYIIPNNARDEQLYSKFREIIQGIENKYEHIENGEFGGCWLWLYDSLHDLTRALINKERIEINDTGKYLCFPFEFNDARSLAQRENMVKELAEELKKEFKVDCGYFSVLNSDDINGLLFYCSQDFDNYESRLINSQYQ